MKSRYEKDPDMVDRKIADEVILVPIRHNVGDLQYMYTLDDVASRIWELIDDRMTVEQMRDIIAAEYEVTPEQIEADLYEFLNDLEQIGAIAVVTSDASSQQVSDNRRGQ